MKYPTKLSWRLKVNPETLQWSLNDRMGDTWEDLLDTICRDLIDYSVDQIIKSQIAYNNIPLPKGLGFPSVRKPNRRKNLETKEDDLFWGSQQ